MRKITYSTIYGLLATASTALAQNISIVNPIAADSFAEIIRKISALIIQIGVPLATVFLIYSGLLFVIARGNEKKLESAKETFKWTVIGTALIVGGAAIASAVVDFATKL